MPNAFQQGFESQPNEIVCDALPVTGTLPAWLHGTLVRNGPGQFETEDRAYRHWFDGQAMLHAFTIADGRVSYRNRYLRTRSYQADTANGQINYRGFATDPCRTRFQKLIALFDDQRTDNTNVNITRLADRYIAMTESPMPLAFDPRTLATLGEVAFQGEAINAQTATAHPHHDAERGLAYNYMLRIGYRSAYQVHQFDGLTTRRVTNLPVQAPAYLHSFGMTRRYIVLAEFSLRLPDLRHLLGLAFMERPFIENFVYNAAQPSRFIVIDKDTGATVAIAETEAFFAFHHINAFERDDAIVLDIAAYSDDDVIRGLYLDNLRGDYYPTENAQFRRYRIPLNNGPATYETPFTANIELPRLNDAVTAREYRYAYGIGLREGMRDFTNQLVKLDLHTGSAATWYEAGVYPSEPVFVPAPEASEEDQGVILSVILDTHAATSALLVLDAASFTERARVRVPQHIPFNFHGAFFT